MNSKIKYTLLFASLLIFASCNDSFLDREPTHNLNNVNYWTSANDLKVYNNGIYNEAAKNEQALLRGHAHISNSKTLSFTALEALSDNFAVTDGDLNSWLVIGAGQEVIPSGIPTSGIGANWRWSVLYRCNFFLENYQRATAVETTLRNNYAGEVYFLRAWFYFDKIREFGDAPLITHTLDITSEELFEAQSGRATVMDAVLSDINQAIEWLPDTWGTAYPDRATRWTAYALKSRICLFEGTFRKYHNIDGSEKFLREAADAADKLIQSGKHSLYNTGNPTSDYRKVFTSTSLAGNPEVLLARVYEIPGLGHALSRNLTTMMAGATKDFVDDFLCIEADGTAKPIALSSVYRDDEIEQLFDNRDPRLSQTILDPRMEEEIYHSDSKMFPRFKGMGSAFQSVTGYHFIKTFDYDDSQRSIGSEINDCALIRYAETLLDYAEAKAELGDITQADLDKSINKLRERAGMPHVGLNPPMDPKYASEGISSLLVEIRRERRIELSFEYARYFDLMRWKKGSYLIKPLLGMRVEDKDLEEGGRYAGAQIERVSIDGKKYVDPYAGMPVGADLRTFDENKNYLHPVPINVLAKNSNLKQTPNWQN